MIRYIAAHWVLPVWRPPLRRGFVAVANGRIAAMGSLAGDDAPAAVARALSYALDAASDAGSQWILTPGLINAHAHLELTADGPLPRLPQETIADWLLRVVARQRAMPPGPAGAALRLQRCRQGAALILAAGATCVNDISSDGASLTAIAESGLRGVVSMEFFHGDDRLAGIGPILDRYAKDFEGSLDAAVNACPDASEARARLKLGVSPHSPYNVAPNAWRAVVSACRPALVHCHAAESRAEWRWIRGEPSALDALHQGVLGRTLQPAPPTGHTETGSLTPIGYLDAHGLLDASTVVAHGVFATAADRQRLARAGASVAHCPRSNLALNDRTLYWPAWQAFAEQVCLGTDSSLSAPDLDLRAEARAAMALHASHGWDAALALATVTCRGARALGEADALGALKPGAWADMTLWSALWPDDRSPENIWLDAQTTPQTVWTAGERRWQADPNPCAAETPELLSAPSQ